MELFAIDSLFEKDLDWRLNSRLPFFARQNLFVFHLFTEGPEEDFPVMSLRAPERFLGYPDANHSRRSAQSTKPANFSLHKPALPISYGTHHSKAMLVVYRGGGVRVVVHTANLIYIDWNNKTQGLWHQASLRTLNPFSVIFVRFTRTDIGNVHLLTHG